MPGQLITNEDSSPPGAKGQKGGRGQRGLPGDFGEFGLPGLPGPYGQLGVEGLSVGLMNSRLFETNLFSFHRVLKEIAETLVTVDRLGLEVIVVNKVWQHQELKDLLETLDTLAYQAYEAHRVKKVRIINIIKLDLFYFM